MAVAPASSLFFALVALLFVSLGVVGVRKRRWIGATMGGLLGSLWHPVANLLGLHTAYQLDRVAGRYDDIDHERTRPRTVYALAPQRPLDISRITRRYRALAPIVDAEYGSATFVSGREPATFEVRVTTSGLLARRV